MVKHNTTFLLELPENIGISIDCKRLTRVKQSAVSDKLKEYNHSVDFDHLDILALNVNRFKFLIKEALFIKCDQPQLRKAIISLPVKLFDCR